MAEQPSCKRQVSGSNPLTGSQVNISDCPAWQQVSGTLTEAIQSGLLAPGDELPSITELSALQGIGTGVIRHGMKVLAADGLIIARHGRGYCSKPTLFP